MILTKRICNKINYKVILPLKFKINLLTPNKNHLRYIVEDKASHNRVEDKVAHNRMVETKMTFGVLTSLSL